ncbi:MAG: hypothetical protein Q8Q20_04845, partial [bacterium]|nr:hypothetical protein [bacterium]
MEVIHTRSRFSLSTIFRRNEHTIFDLILRLAVIAAVVLTPLVFLTEFRSQFDLHKSLIFSLLTLVAVLAWLAKIVFRKGMRYRRTMLDIPVAVFGLLYVVVTMFSTNWFQSIAGVSNYYQHTLTVMVFTILFFYVIVNNFRTRQEIEALLGSWLAAGVVVTVVSFFQLLGWYPFAADSTHLPDFNLIGSSALALGFYLVSLLPLLLGWMIKAQRPVQRIALFVATVLNFAVLALLDYGLVWYFAIGTLFVYILFLSLRAKKHD